MSVSKVPAVGAKTSGTPISLAHSAHVVQFYQEDHVLVQELARLIGASLVSGDAAIVVATKAHRDALAHELAVLGMNVAAASAEGRYVALDAAESLSRIMIDQVPAPAR